MGGWELLFSELFLDAKKGRCKNQYVPFGDNMNHTNTFNLILYQQKAWAKEQGINFEDSDGYMPSLSNNLFTKTLSKMTLNDYKGGQGKELQTHMRALYSSSALVVNVFEYWRQNQRVGEIAELCGAGFGATAMNFESKHKIANLGTPNLDIEFRGLNVKPFNIEAKFTEPYFSLTTHRNRTNLEKYLKKDILWAGLQNCAQLAQQVVSEEGKTTSWKYLDVSQLLKHILGLTYCYQSRGFTLLYLWYNSGTTGNEEHQNEITKFNNIVALDVDFKSMTYQELFTKIKGRSIVDKDYLSYLTKRYFNAGN